MKLSSLDADFLTIEVENSMNKPSQEICYVLKISVTGSKCHNSIRIVKKYKQNGIILF